MPIPGSHWYHATFSTHNSWLPGDPRGFRSKHHRIHSSGDHRNPPPQGEHAGLHAYAQAITNKPVLLDAKARPIVAHAVINNLKQHKQQLLAIAVGGLHVHLLVQLPSEPKRAKALIGFAKLSASMKLNDTLPGKVWARGCNLKPIRDSEHQRNTYAYISKHRDEGAWVWTFRDGAMDWG